VRPVSTERLLSLRALPVFGLLPIKDLNLIARYTSDRHFRAGAPLHAANEVLDRIQILTHGQVAVSKNGERQRVDSAPIAIGLFPVLAQSAVDYETTAITRVRAVEIDGRRLGDLFDDYPRLLLHAIQQVAQALVTTSSTRVDFAVRGSSLEEVEEPPPGHLNIVERLFFLRKILPLDRISIDALASIARQLEPADFSADETIWKAGDRGDELLVVLRGVVEARKDDGQCSQRDRPGALGGLEALAGVPRWYDLVARTPVEALRLRVDLLIDAFEEHTDMGLDFLAFLATIALELTDLVAPPPDDAANREPVLLAAPSLDALREELDPQHPPPDGATLPDVPPAPPSESA
jgi:CRP-like cAMP-binding protein